MNSSSFESYSNDILQNKIEKILGKKQQEAANVDWQIDEVRTSPVDHRASYTDEEIEKYLQAIVDQKEPHTKEDLPHEMMNSISEKN